MVELSQNPTGVTSAGADGAAVVLLVSGVVSELVTWVVAAGAEVAGCVDDVVLPACEWSAKLNAPRAVAESTRTERAPTAIPEARFMT